MPSSLNWEHAISGSRWSRWVRDWFFRPPSGTAIALFLSAAILLWRRLAGAIHEPLPILGIVFAGVFLALAAGMAHWAGRFFANRYPGATAGSSSSAEPLVQHNTAGQTSSGTRTLSEISKRQIAMLSDFALSLSLFAVAAVLSMPGTSTVGLSLFWLVLLVEEGSFYSQIRLPRVVKESNAFVRT